MSPENLVRGYLQQINIMQLATAADNRPWLCTVHYYSDDGLNFYWISTPAREHSEQIAQNPQVAAYVLVHENTADEPYVIGISITGTAELIGQEASGKVGQNYIKKLNKEPQLLADIAGGQNPHRFYRLKPSRIVLFDSKNFPEQPRQAWQLTP